MKDIVPKTTITKISDFKDRLKTKWKVRDHIDAKLHITFYQAIVIG
jgi:hypothetical protein